ncbi:hypothetical protein B0H19DRAFT_1083906 [Mycena capillaripes]|nr:hypothetical protein B0H19DRAFT_1083906 [Mycena capillaripes]
MAEDRKIIQPYNSMYWEPIQSSFLARKICAAKLDTDFGPGLKWPTLRLLILGSFIPHHGISHTSPNAAVDIANLQGWLESNKLQTYIKECPGHDKILRSRDLMVAGAAYANTPGAFKNFRRETRKVSYRKVSPAADGSESEEEEETIQPEDSQLHAVEEDDLMHDDEEFTHMPDQLLKMARERVGI